MASTTKDETESSSQVHDTDNVSLSPLALEIPGYSPTLTWSPAEARAAVRRVDTFIMPFIILFFVFLQFDRTNISNALTDTFRADVHIDNYHINLAQTLFIVGFVITELPFNMISKVLGPERFLPLTMLLWGTVTWCQMFIRNPSGLYACRFLIGALEGGYIPGMALYISRFYTNQELGLRFAFFWASNSIAGMLSGPLAIGLLSLRGKHGLAGWQWLFLIEGVLTCVLSVFAYLYLPHGAAAPKVFFNRSASLFNDRQASIIVTRVLRNDPTKALRHGKPVLPSHILETFADWKLYGHIISAFLTMVMIQPVNTYAPSIIKSLGFSGLQANGMNSVGSACALILSVTLAYSSDRLRERGLHITFGFLCGAAGLFWLAFAKDGVSKWVLYGGVVMTQMGMGSAQAINAAWLTSKMADYKRPVALAAYVMSIQLAGLPGNQLFRQQDAPRYTRGLAIAGACAVAGAVVIMVWKILYRMFDGGDSGVEVTEKGSRDVEEQYCVGTRRRTILQEQHIKNCRRPLDRVDSASMSNFEMRMVAEVHLYWTIYQQSNNTPINRPDTELALRTWRAEWESLFDQPRSQFLQMGYYFALLLTLGQAVKSTHSRMGDSPLSELVRLTTSIINLAMDTTDERTQHLTDHIYHVITFSALTLCQLLNNYEERLCLSHDISALDSLVTKLVVWFRSIGLSCHVTHMLGNLVYAQQTKLRPDAAGTPYSGAGLEGLPSPNLEFPEFISGEMFDVETELWPPWDQVALPR
ncbi:related to nicotinamide mononucleotide permease [Cephalotrichum gorgonifer]|uniref:Related to nicotinamide mononucleotide permease n=1 Tax=Cephalotrichum gorgonifer TaxID=2041049 RepID=A0AAE8SRV2_9PEZI|nr:related to nicotinamide mononucleotide permease [Cephalotrichum gorgonifer]